MVDEKHPDEWQGRKEQWFKSNDMSVPASNDEPADDTAALAEDLDVGVRVLAEHYDLAELTGDQFDLDAEIGTLEQRIEALAGRTPRYVETLEERLLALEAARPAFENEYADTSSWESLEQHGDFD